MCFWNVWRVHRQILFLLACISSFLVFSFLFFSHDWFLFSISFVLFFIFCFVKYFDFDFAVVLSYFQKCILGGEIMFILFLWLFLFNFCLSFCFLFYFSVGIFPLIQICLLGYCFRIHMYMYIHCQVFDLLFFFFL